MKEKMNKKGVRKTVIISASILIAAAVVGAYLIISGLGERLPKAEATWNSISSVRVNFSKLVTNRNFTVGAESDIVNGDLVLREPYFNENDFVLPFKGRVKCEKDVFDCSLDVRAPVRFKIGEVYAGELRLGGFSTYDFNLGANEKFVAATLFGLIKDRIVIQKLGVDKDFKAIHRINNDFIEFEK